MKKSRPHRFIGLKAFLSLYLLEFLGFFCISNNKLDLITDPVFYLSLCILPMIGSMFGTSIDLFTRQSRPLRAHILGQLSALAGTFVVFAIVNIVEEKNRKEIDPLVVILGGDTVLHNYIYRDIERQFDGADYEASGFGLQSDDQDTEKRFFYIQFRAYSDGKMHLNKYMKYHNRISTVYSGKMETDSEYVSFIKDREKMVVALKKYCDNGFR